MGIGAQSNQDETRQWIVWVDRVVLAAVVWLLLGLGILMFGPVPLGATTEILKEMSRTHDAEVLHAWFRPMVGLGFFAGLIGLFATARVAKSPWERLRLHTVVLGVLMLFGGGMMVWMFSPLFGKHV